jgi:hypothetical protein
MPPIVTNFAAKSKKNLLLVAIFFPLLVQCPVADGLFAWFHGHWTA